MESSWSSRPSLRVNWLTIRDKGNKRRVKPIENNNKNGNSSNGPMKVPMRFTHRIKPPLPHQVKEKFVLASLWHSKILAGIISAFSHGFVPSPLPQTLGIKSNGAVVRKILNQEREKNIMLVYWSWLHTWHLNDRHYSAW